MPARLSVRKARIPAAGGLFRPDRANGGCRRCVQFQALSGLRFNHLLAKPAKLVHSRYQIIDLRNRRSFRADPGFGRRTIILHHEILSQSVGRAARPRLSTPAMYLHLFEQNVNDFRSASSTRHRDHARSIQISTIHRATWLLLPPAGRGRLHGAVKPGFVAVLWRNRPCTKIVIGDFRRRLQDESLPAHGA